MVRQLELIGQLVLVILGVCAVSRADVEASAVVPAVKLADGDTISAEGAPSVAPPLLAYRRPDRVPFEVKRRFEGFELPETFRDSIVSIARAQVGKRYRFGGTTPQRGFDCSGLIRYVLSKIDLALPRTAYLQARVGAPVSPEQLLPGDLLSFGPADSVSHIGIYIGDGKFIHASSVAGRVIVSALDRKPSRLIKPLHGARRLLALAEASGRRGD